MKHARVALDYEQRIASLEAAILDLLAMHKALQRANDVLFGALIVRGLKDQAEAADETEEELR